jgi:hypothetical protein
MPTFETPYGTVDAPDLGAAQKWIARQKGGQQGAGIAPSGPQAPQAGQASPGLLERMWSGLVGKPQSEADKAAGKPADTGALGAAWERLKSDKPLLGVGPQKSPLQESAEQAIPYRPGTKAGAMMPANPLANPMVTAMGVGNIGKPMPPPAAAPAQTLQRFQRIAPMSTAGMNNAADIAKQQADRLSTAKSIVAEKPNLSFETPKGTVTGRLPDTVEEFSQAHGQTMNKLFQKWDAMTQSTEGGAATPAMASAIGKFRNAFYAASNKLAEETEGLKRAELKLQGELASPTGRETGAVRTATQALYKAEDRVKSANAERVAASKEMQKPWVDLKPVAAELEKFADNPGLKLTAGSEGVIKYAKKQAEKYAEEEAGSPSAVQQAITNANASLKSFYSNPSYKSAARAGVDAMIANQQRKALDELISGVTGPGYQKLKLEYGAMAATQKEVTRAAIKAMGNTAEARFLEGLTNAGTAEEVVRAITTMSLEPAARSIMFRAAHALQRLYNSPDRQVRLMFQGLDLAPPRSIGGAMPSGLALPTAGIVERKERKPLRSYPPSVGAPSQ